MSTLAQTSPVFPADGRPERTAPRQAPADTLADGAGRAADPEEVLVRDARAGLSPSQMVERKLQSLLNGRPLPPGPACLSAARRPARSLEL